MCQQHLPGLLRHAHDIESDNGSPRDRQQILGDSDTADLVNNPRSCTLKGYLGTPTSVTS